MQGPKQPRFSKPAATLLVVLVLLNTACREDTATPVVNPKPGLISFTPTTITWHDSATIVLTGTGFVPNSEVRIAGLPVASKYVSARRIDAGFLVGLTLQPPAGVRPVIGFYPPLGGGESAPLQISLLNPVPVITGIFPDSIATNQGAVTLLVLARNLGHLAVARWNGADRPTFAITSSSQLNVRLSEADIAIPGIYPVTVVIPLAASASNAVNVRVVQAPAR